MANTVKRMQKPTAISMSLTIDVFYGRAAISSHRNFLGVEIGLLVSVDAISSLSHSYFVALTSTRPYSYIAIANSRISPFRPDVTSWCQSEPRATTALQH